ncbi:MAG: helix-turn-helix domain-containing protein [Ruminococcaceae bacterium]|nr:helix-turn-helix domain-containing protein [Oscillospiraceae bacterium]
MKNFLSQREQKYYIALFKHAELLNMECNNGLKLFIIADVHCKSSNECNGIHKQWCDEITFVYSGEGEVITNDKREPIRQGQIHLCFKEDMHQIIPSRINPLKFYCIGFELENSNPLYNLRNQAKSQILSGQDSIIKGMNDMHSSCMNALSTIKEEENNQIHSALATNSLNYIIGTVLKKFTSTNENYSKSISMKESLLFYVISYLKNNVYNINALKNLPADIGYSYSYISHLFSDVMKESLKDFFIKLRMETATELLRETSVTKVSNMLGYSSVHAFTRAYKTACGKAPSSLKSDNSTD